MYILTRHNRIIDYCNGGYLCMGSYVLCSEKNKAFYDCTIVDIGETAIPSDLLISEYTYIEGVFTKIGPKAVRSINCINPTLRPYGEVTERDAAKPTYGLV